MSRFVIPRNARARSQGHCNWPIRRRVNFRELSRLDYQPLFGKGARAPPPNSRREERRLDSRKQRKSSLGIVQFSFFLVFLFMVSAGNLLLSFALERSWFFYCLNVWQRGFVYGRERTIKLSRNFCLVQWRRRGLGAGFVIRRSRVQILLPATIDGFVWWS